MNTDQMTEAQRLIHETTPGGILLREFLEPLGLSQAELARRTGLPTSRITEIVKGRRAITGETAVALGTFFGNRPQFWLNLQSGCDLRRIELEGADEIRKRVQPLEVA